MYSQSGMGTGNLEWEIQNGNGKFRMGMGNSDWELGSQESRTNIPLTCHERHSPQGLLNGDLRDSREVLVGVVGHDDPTEQDGHDTCGGREGERRREGARERKGGSKGEREREGKRKGGRERGEGEMGAGGEQETRGPTKQDWKIGINN